MYFTLVLAVLGTTSPSLDHMLGIPSNPVAAMTGGLLLVLLSGTAAALRYYLLAKNVVLGPKASGVLETLWTP
jgi:hypothetical protein